MIDMENANEFCEYFLKHTSEGIGDGRVFKYHVALACENYDCPYGNHDGKKILYEGEGPEFGFCLSEGSKVRMSLENNSDSN